MLLHVRMRAIQHIPRSTTPTAISDLFGFEWLTCGIFHKPVWVLTKDRRIRFRDKRGKPDSGLFTLCANIGNHLLNTTGEFLRRRKPIAHKGLIAVIQQHPFQFWVTLRQYRDILFDILFGHLCIIGVPRTPAHWCGIFEMGSWRMVARNRLCIGLVKLRHGFAF